MTVVYSRNLISEEKIDQIDQRLSRLNDLVESLLANNTRTTNEVVSNRPETCLASRPRLSQRTSASPLDLEMSHQKMSREATNNAILGQSSFTAHSTFAIDLAHSVVSTNQPTGSNHKIEPLLEILRHIGTAFSERHVTSMHLFPLVVASASLEDYQMPPLEEAVKILRKSQGMLPTLIYWQLLMTRIQMNEISFSLPCLSSLAHEVCRIYA